MLGKSGLIPRHCLGLALPLYQCKEEVSFNVKISLCKYVQHSGWSIYSTVWLHTVCCDVFIGCFSRMVATLLRTSGNCICNFESGLLFHTGLFYQELPIIYMQLWYSCNKLQTGGWRRREGAICQKNYVGLKSLYITLTAIPVNQ